MNRFFPKGLLLWLACLLVGAASAYGQLTDTTKVVINDLGNYFQIENGWLGVRIPKQSLFNPSQPAPAPIKCIVYKDGTLSNQSTNTITSTTLALTMTHQILYQNNDSCGIKLSYTFNKPPLEKSGSIWEPAGPGYYNVTIRMVKGKKVAVITEESDYEISYEFKVSDGLNPDRARYQGHHASNPQNGYDMYGGTFNKGEGKGWQAQVDLSFGSRKDYPFLTRWNPWSVNTGWWWTLFNNSAGNSANLLGIFDGRASLLLGAQWSGAHFYTDAGNVTGLRSNHQRISPNNVYAPDIRFQWCIWVDKKSSLGAQNVVPVIAKTWSKVGGIGDKWHRYLNTPATIHSAFFNGAVYMPQAEFQAVMNKIKTDNAFYDVMKNVDNYYKDVMDAWRDPTTTKTIQVYNKIKAYSDSLYNGLVLGDGIYSYHHQYILGANDMQKHAMYMIGLMADNKLTNPQRDTLKKHFLLYARIMWDDDFTPFFEAHKLNFGTGNMPMQYQGFRWFFALLLKDDPQWTARVNAISNTLRASLHSQINRSGAARGTPHYLQPSLDVLLQSALQLKNAGLTNVFVTSDTLRRFGEFLIDLQTPKSVRFSNQRKVITFGDGNEESAAVFGLLATGLASVDAALSKRLMYAYRNGPTRKSDFGYVTMSIDHNLPDDGNMKIGSGHFPGYLSTFRSAVGTTSETAAWFINGDWYNDHRNDDRGSLALYALGAPLTLNYGSFYSPHQTGGHMKSICVPETDFPQWNQGGQPFQIGDGETWNSSTHQAYVAFKHGHYSKARFNVPGNQWTRQVYQFTPKTATPIFVVKDNFTNVNQNMVWSFNFMGRDVVQTPSGPVDPPAAFNGNPSPSSNIPLPAGGLKRFDFTGIQWNLHPQGGINWEVYVAPKYAQDCNLTEWAHNSHPNIEKQEYQASNGASFEERQIMMRIRGKEEFYTVIVPYNKGQRPANLNVTRSGETVSVSTSAFTFNTDLNTYTYSEPAANKNVLATYTTQSLTFANTTISGGPTEVEIKPDSVFTRVHGAPGARTLTLPSGNWSIVQGSSNASYNASTGKWTLNYNYTDSLNNASIGGYYEFIFKLGGGGGVKVSPKVLLEGAYNSGAGTMNDNLRSGNLLPLSQPYTNMPGFQHVNGGGSEQTTAAALAVTGNNAIVDWVFLQLRDKNNSSNVIATRAALVQRDGDIVDMDGTSPVTFNVAPDNYFVAVRQRNHLGVMKATVSALSGTTTAIDFTSPGTPVYGNNARKDLGGGKLGLWGGDLNGSGTVDAADRSKAWNERNQSGYLQSDATLDGVTSAADRSITWNNRNLVAQLP